MRRNRLTYSRDGGHPGLDPFDRYARRAYATVAMSAVTVFSMLVPASAFSVLLLALALVLLLLAWVACTVRIRPRVFDREQREHEIVPPYYAEEQRRDHVR